MQLGRPINRLMLIDKSHKKQLGRPISRLILIDKTLKKQLGRPISRMMLIDKLLNQPYRPQHGSPNAECELPRQGRI